MAKKFLLLSLGITGSLAAQPASRVSEDARRFVKVDAPLVALTHVRVIDGTGAPPLDDQTVVIADGRIRAIGASGEAIDAGELAGPRMFVTGPYLEGEGSFTFQMHELTGPEDAVRMVEYWADMGVTSFKVYTHITREQLSAAIRAAHELGIKVIGHTCSVSFEEAAELGIDCLEQGLVVDTGFYEKKEPNVCPPSSETRDALLGLDVGGPVVQATIAALVANDVAVTSTLAVFETFVPNRLPLQQRVLDVMLPEARVSYLARRSRIGEQKDSAWNELFKKEMEFERAFVAAGGLLLTSPDPTGYGGVVAGFGDQRGSSR